MPNRHQRNDSDRRPQWAQRVLLDELRDQARRRGVPEADRLSQPDLVRALRARRPSGDTDWYAAYRS